jgi:hypothetical protein
MKQIFHIKLLLSALLVSVSFISCDYLDEKPDSQYTIDNYYINSQTLKAGVIGIYSKLINLYLINTDTPIFLSMLGTDELCYRTSNTNVRSTVDRYTYTSSEGCIGEYWARYYSIIGQANVVIDAASRITNITESERNQCVGEARFLRAWSYFQLVQMFGDVPLIIGKTNSFNYSIPRSPLSEVYNVIVEDLNFASGDSILPKEITDGHAGYWAAKTLLAKVYLTMASAKKSAKVEGYSKIVESIDDLYSKAYVLLDEIINKSGRELLPKYEDVFKIENKNVNKESIWEIQFSATEPYGTQWPKELGLVNKGYSKTDGGWRYCCLGGSFNINVIPSFRGYYKSYKDRKGKVAYYDNRKDWNVMDSIITYNSSTGKPIKIESINTIVGIKGTAAANDYTLNDNVNLVNYSSATKYRWGNSWKDYPMKFIYSNCPNNVIALRFSDVLLMYAEAEMALNGGKVKQTGLDAVNRIIQRARGLKPDGSKITSAETPGFDDYTMETLTFVELMKERSRELCFEFWRRHDLARTGMFEYFLAARDNASNIKTNFDPTKNYLLPIPQYEIDNSENKDGMYQNPNY